MLWDCTHLFCLFLNTYNTFLTETHILYLKCTAETVMNRSQLAQQHYGVVFTDPQNWSQKAFISICIKTVDCSGLLRTLLRALPQQTQWPKLDLTRQRNAHLPTHEPLPKGTCFRAFIHLHLDQERKTRGTDTAGFNMKLQMPEECHKLDRINMRELIERIQFRSRNCCKNITSKTDQK